MNSSKALTRAISAALSALQSQAGRGKPIRTESLAVELPVSVWLDVLSALDAQAQPTSTAQGPTAAPSS